MEGWGNDNNHPATPIDTLVQLSKSAKTSNNKPETTSPISGWSDDNAIATSFTTTRHNTIDPLDHAKIHAQVIKSVDHIGNHRNQPNESFTHLPLPPRNFPLHPQRNDVPLYFNHRPNVLLPCPKEFKALVPTNLKVPRSLNQHMQFNTRYTQFQNGHFKNADHANNFNNTNAKANANTTNHAYANNTNHVNHANNSGAFAYFKDKKEMIVPLPQLAQKLYGLVNNRSPSRRTVNSCLVLPPNVSSIKLTKCATLPSISLHGRDKREETNTYNCMQRGDQWGDFNDDFDNLDDDLDDMVLEQRCYESRSRYAHNGSNQTTTTQSRADRSDRSQQKRSHRPSRRKRSTRQKKVRHLKRRKTMTDQAKRIIGSALIGDESFAKQYSSSPTSTSKKYDERRSKKKSRQLRRSSSTNAMEQKRWNSPRPRRTSQLKDKRYRDEQHSREQQLYQHQQQQYRDKHGKDWVAPVFALKNRNATLVGGHYSHHPQIYSRNGAGGNGGGACNNADAGQSRTIVLDRGVLKGAMKYSTDIVHESWELDLYAR
jgi:hypothetical protein